MTKLTQKDSLRVLQTALAEMPQVDCPVKHVFSKGVYTREMLIPKDTVIIGKTHKTQHLNFILQGSVRVALDDYVIEMQAPYYFVSNAGVKKAVYAYEDTIWVTIHPTSETDITKLEEELIEQEPPELLEKLKATLLGGVE